MNGIIKKWVLLIPILVLTSSVTAQAQSKLEIAQAFELFGQQKGSTMVEMKKSMLKDYPFDFYKSLIITDNTKAIRFTRQCVEKDQKGAEKIKQVVSDGKINTLFLQLPKEGKKHRLILYNETDVPQHKMTLIYIESAQHPDTYMDIILQKK